MATSLTPRQKYVLAALAADPGACFESVQIQKLLFLLDENITDAPGGKQFDFKPYDYGPFDKDVYVELEALQERGLVQMTTISPNFSRRQYSLTFNGQKQGGHALKKFAPDTAAYVKDLSRWVRQQSFATLVGSIYKAYPHMRENSIFQD